MRHEDRRPDQESVQYQEFRPRGRGDREVEELIEKVDEIREMAELDRSAETGVWRD